MGERIRIERWDATLHNRATQSDRHPPGRLFSGRGIRAPSRKCAGPPTSIICGFEPGPGGVRIRTLKRMYTGCDGHTGMHSTPIDSD